MEGMSHVDAVTPADYLPHAAVDWRPHPAAQLWHSWLITLLHITSMNRAHNMLVN
jgi:hypothetical protein